MCAVGKTLEEGGGHTHSHDAAAAAAAAEHGHTHEVMENPGLYSARDKPLHRGDWKQVWLIFVIK